MLLSIAGWSVLDDVAYTTSVRDCSSYLCVLQPVLLPLLLVWPAELLQARLCVQIGGHGAARFSAACCRLRRRHCSLNCCVTAAWRKDVHSDSIRVQCRLVTPRTWVGLRNVGSQSSTDSASNPEKQHSAVQTATCQVMIERSRHVIAGLSSRWCAGAACSPRIFVRHFCSFDIARFVCIVRVAHAACEVASAFAVVRYASVGRKARRL